MLHFKALILSTLFVFALSGCQTPPPLPAAVPITSIQDRFDGPGGTAVHDFVNASNACQRETSRMNQYNNAPVIPSCSSVIRCLAGKGYVSSPSGKFDAEELRIGATCTAQ
ncbi:hypothetical protein B9Z51_17170 [Limnohabitans sp. T6-5]|uniref:hypothetical protein n=1 Tax=Limnohabitans sp. T6-5 TaxID=1100724 RepID=UPI000D390378|nr:hypothetical protein [Limnohabitans sp. T6-5]PUE05979.1 hypothetical protein B9Z51_17170 [Limnohabitans sp. T6-5]